MLLLRICTAMLRKHAATHKELKRQTGLPEKQMSNSVAILVKKYLSFIRQIFIPIAFGYAKLN